MSKAIKKIVPIATSIIGNSIAPGIGGAIGAGLGTKVTGGSWGDALKAGAFNFAGNKLGSALGNSSFGKSLGLDQSVGKTLGFTGNVAKDASGFMLPGGGSIGAFAGNSLADTFLSGSLGQAIGSYAGNSLAERPPEGPKGPAPFSPAQQAEQELPTSLSAFGGLNPNQLSSNIATQGVFGGGAGPQEQNYFMNLINRRLVDESGKVDQDLSDVNPIESSYLAQLGLGGYNNPTSLLEAMSKWKAA